jgi:2-polyprenyl-3-methyl-5-hydroxy-6-metoxy-1,4-benzoquinol methylase
VRPKELNRWGRLAGLEPMDVSGLCYLPYIGYTALCKPTIMNYVMHFKKPKGAGTDGFMAESPLV